MSAKLNTTDFPQRFLCLLFRNWVFGCRNQLIIETQDHRINSGVCCLLNSIFRRTHTPQLFLRSSVSMINRFLYPKTQLRKTRHRNLWGKSIDSNLTDVHQLGIVLGWTNDHRQKKYYRKKVKSKPNKKGRNLCLLNVSSPKSNSFFYPIWMSTFCVTKDIRSKL